MRLFRPTMDDSTLAFMRGFIEARRWEKPNLDDSTLAAVRGFIGDRRWKELNLDVLAESLFSYTAREWQPDAQEDFDRFITAIRAFGKFRWPAVCYDGKFRWRTPYRINVDGFKYCVYVDDTTFIIREQKGR